MSLPKESEIIGQPKKYKCDYCGSVFWHVEHLDQQIQCPSCGAPDPKAVAESLVEKAVLIEERGVEVATGAPMGSVVNAVVGGVIALVGIAAAGFIPGLFSSITKGLTRSTSGPDLDLLLKGSLYVVISIAVVAVFWRNDIPTDNPKEEEEDEDES